MIFASLARPHERVHVQIVGDFLQTKLDSEINAPFLLNEYDDGHFLFYKFNENNMLNKGLYGGGGGGGSTGVFRNVVVRKHMTHPFQLE